MQLLPLPTALLERGDFLHKAKIEPSGKYCIATSEANNIYVISLENSLTEKFLFPNLIFDFDLLPSTTTNCILISSKDCPIQLKNIQTNSLVNCYMLKNDKEEFLSANTVAFDPTGCEFVAGTKNSLFSISVETGKKMQQLFLCDRKISINCAKYFFSCPHMIACGSYMSNFIGICDLRLTDPLQMSLHAPPEGNGIFQVHPIGEHLVLSGSRRENSIHLWDLRMQTIIQSFDRKYPPSYQKMFFETIWTNELFHIVYGDADGNVHLNSMIDNANAECIKIANSPVSNILPFYSEGELRLFCCSGERFSNEQASTYTIKM